MTAKSDIKGVRYGHLVAVKESDFKDKKRRVHWYCRCDCGRYLIVRGDNLRRGGSTGCSLCSQKGSNKSKFVSKEEATS